MKSPAFSTQKFLSPQEQKRLNAVLERTNTRDRVLFQTLLATGARASEVLAIRHEDLDLEHRSVFIRGLKGSNDRQIPLKPHLFKDLHSLATDNPYKPVFNISYVRLSQLWDVYRPARKKLHSTRHTFAINLYRRHKDLKLVQLALGHRSINSTMVYADFVYSTSQMRRLII